MNNGQFKQVENLRFHEFPPLFSLDKKGKTKEWKITVHDHEKFSEITVLYGYIRKIETKTRVYQGKNQGKKNSTTHFSQAIKEARSKWDKKHDVEGYTEVCESSDLKPIKSPVKVPLLPMLAQDFHKHSKKVVFPCYIQPKLDGYRMLLENGKKSSRQGKPFEALEGGSSLILNSSLQRLCHLYPDITFDGELYAHGQPFEKLGVLRKKKIDDNNLVEIANLETIEYHVYDFVSSLPFENRTAYLTKIFKDHQFPKIKLVETRLIKTPEEIEVYNSLYLIEGYEGSIIRNFAGKYIPKFRSYDLLKLKQFEDDEFEIVDFTSEKRVQSQGKLRLRPIVWICQTKSGDIFNVRPQGTMEERALLYTRGQEFIGSCLWVKYANLTETGVPRFPSTKTTSYESYIRNEKL